MPLCVPVCAYVARGIRIGGCRRRLGRAGRAAHGMCEAAGGRPAGSTRAVAHKHTSLPSCHARTHTHSSTPAPAPAHALPLNTHTHAAPHPHPQVDSILIDEARTPLIISGTADKPSEKYYKVCGCVCGCVWGFREREREEGVCVYGCVCVSVKSVCARGVRQHAIRPLIVFKGRREIGRTADPLPCPSHHPLLPTPPLPLPDLHPPSTRPPPPAGRQDRLGAGPRRALHGGREAAQRVADRGGVRGGGGRAAGGRVCVWALCCAMLCCAAPRCAALPMGCALMCCAALRFECAPPAARFPRPRCRPPS